MSWDIIDRLDDDASLFSGPSVKHARDWLVDELLLIDPGHHAKIDAYPGKSGLAQLWEVCGDSLGVPYRYQLKHII